MMFGNLLKKELGELINKQTIIGMIVSFSIFAFMGIVLGSAMEEGFSASEITVCNKDDSQFTKDVLERVTADGSVKINYIDIATDDYAAEMAKLEDVDSFVIIPENYGKSVIEDKKPADIIVVGTFHASGLSSSISTISSADLVSEIQTATSDEVLLQSYGLTEEEIARVNGPAKVIDYTVSGEKYAKVSASALQSVSMSQSMIAPMAIFFLLLMASQMIMTAISTEKIDKTLETLLSTPVSRLTVLSAKMVAALITALLNAGVTLLGLVVYMFGMLGGITSDITESTNMAAAESIGDTLSIAQAMIELDIMITPMGYVLLGLQLFLTVAIGLSVSLILGAMATDTKSLQNLTMPIMFATMIPFFVTMFMDINTMQPVLKVIMFLIPFTHSYTALVNIMSGDMLMYWIGFAYQLLFFAVCMYMAVKVFTTDKLFTMSDGGSAGGR